MIFLILGTQKFQLDRLLQEMDQLCETGKITDSVYAQIGHSTYHPKHYDYVDFLDKKDFDKKIEESSLVVTHSGVGSIISALELGKPVIVYPRLSKYKEHVDDHQLEIARVLEKKNFALCCHDGDDLFQLINKAEKHSFDTYKSSTGNIISLIHNFLEGI